MRLLRPALVLLLLAATNLASAAITYVGTTWTPIDNMPLTDSAPRAIAPVSGMATGDLVVVEVAARAIDSNILVSATGRAASAASPPVRAKRKAGARPLSAGLRIWAGVIRTP